MRSFQPERIIGRYALFREIASGGMASVHLGRLLGPVGFSRVVAIKRLHPHLARDPEFVTMFVDEARLAARVQHPNVVQTLDVVALEGELFIVMEYVEGESLARLARLSKESGKPIPPPVISAIMLGVLHGLHAAHEARGEGGRPLRLVHRDVSPQNILVGVDGLARVVDFGIAMAAGRTHRTASGVLKGKLRYMAPEQIFLEPIDRRTDVYGASVVLWELLAGRRLFEGDNDWQVAEQIKAGKTPPPSQFNSEVSPELDQVALKGLAQKPDDRFASALDMADALMLAGPSAVGRTVGKQVESLAAELLDRRRRWVDQAESIPSDANVAALDDDRGSDSARVAVPPPSASTVDTEALTGVASAKTRPGGRFAQTPEAASKSVGARSSSGELPVVATDEGPGTVKTWSAAIQRRFPISPPMIGVLAGTLVALAIGLVVLTIRAFTTKPGTAETPTATQPVEQKPSGVTSSVPPPPPITSAEPSETAVGSELPPPPPPRTEVAARKPKTSPPPSGSPTTTTKKPNCEVPWWYDANGDKHFRRECLNP